VEPFHRGLAIPNAANRDEFGLATEGRLGNSPSFPAIDRSVVPPAHGKQRVANSSAVRENRGAKDANFGSTTSSKDEQ
jgi:hypothetical protein